MQGTVPKQYLALARSTVIEHTLSILLAHPRISGVVVVINRDDSRWQMIRLNSRKPLIAVPGGEERHHSVLNGLHYLQAQALPDDWVLVHDAARPCLRVEDLDKLIDTLAGDSVGGLLAAPVRDTMKQVDQHGRVEATVDRRGLWHALTPQMFRLGMLSAALQTALQANRIVTDESAAVEAMGLAPRLVEGHADNIKITHPEDLALAEFYLERMRNRQC